MSVTSAMVSGSVYKIEAYLTIYDRCLPTQPWTVLLSLYDLRTNSNVAWDDGQSGAYANCTEQQQHEMHMPAGHYIQPEAGWGWEGGGTTHSPDD
jgi:hypothetical protein